MINISKSFTASICALLVIPLVPSPALATSHGTNGRILYGENVDGYAQLITQEANGTDPLKITPDNNQIITSYAWSTDGKYVYYVKGGSADHSAIYMIDNDGSNETRISQYGVAGDIAASNDGTTIFYTNGCLGVLDISSGNNACIKNTYASNPVVSPDDNFLVYSDLGGVNILNIETNEATRLNITSGQAYPVSWSPDNTKIAFISVNQEGSYRRGYFMYFYETSTGKITPFDPAQTSRDNIYSAAFSPDGTSIVYQAVDSDNGVVSIKITHGLSYSVPTETISTNATWQGEIDWQALETGTTSSLPKRPSTIDVYRFYSPIVKRHLYTANEYEAEYIDQNMHGTWNFEGPSFSVREIEGCPTDHSVYRFYSQLLKTHMYTMDENEKSSIIKNFPQTVWQYEGIAYCADKTQTEGTIPVYRFYSATLKTHLYTVDENEKNEIIAKFPKDIWSYEGIAYYAYHANL